MNGQSRRITCPSVPEGSRLSTSRRRRGNAESAHCPLTGTPLIFLLAFQRLILRQSRHTMQEIRNSDGGRFLCGDYNDVKVSRDFLLPTFLRHRFKR